MIELKHTNGKFEFMRFLPGIDEGIVVVRDGRSYFQRHLEGDDFRGALE